MSSGTFSIYESDYRIVSHFQSALLHMIFNIFVSKFAWVILMSSPLKYTRGEKYSPTYVDYFFENFTLCYGQPYYII